LIKLNCRFEKEAQLLYRERKWHLPPDKLPPKWGQRNNGRNGSHHPSSAPEAATSHQNGNGGRDGPPSSIVVTPASSASARTSNRYGALFQEDDDEDSSDDDDEDTTVAGEPDEAGDQVTFRPTSDTARNIKQPCIEGMDMRRIMIRIYNAQSDAYSLQATIYRKQYPPEWQKGARRYSYCLHKVHSALFLADVEIVKWMSYANTNRRHQNPSMYKMKIIELLKEDASIVEIAVQTMSSNRNQYMSAAKQYEAKLLSKLRPQWRARDEVKQKMGERWTNNKNPKNEYAALRVDLEQELNDIRAALKCLSELDFTVVEVSSKQLREKIQMGEDGVELTMEMFTEHMQTPLTSPASTGPPMMMMEPYPSPQYQVPDTSMSPYYNENHEMNDQSNASPYAVQAPSQNRYNGLRPVDLSRRVDMQLYPDPTMFGWIFTGSIGVTEFFEKEEVKLDWFYTTATVKTSMYHPTQGRTQLFGARVDPETYRKILDNPRIHTGVRYQNRRY
jgi:hypothetical protein